MRRAGKLFLVYFLVTQVIGSAIGAFVAVSFGPDAVPIIMEVISCV